MKTRTKNKQKKQKTNYRLWVYIVLLIFVAIIYFWTANASKQTTDKPVNKTSQKTRQQKPKSDAGDIIREMEISFHRLSGEFITNLEVEVADDPQRRVFGLMHRESLGENQGMLFIFEEEEPRSFWMRNTIIPLDIMFVGKDKTIINIVKNTIPKSETKVLSDAPALYVIEVNAGWSGIYGVSNGDKVEF
ncbi:MAG: DUF192 domain-containing protein [Candidatus Cloacimonetes bacterium]|nr:DUF192 domain-containing protein [Candidatus Cloacimonadota bacterium]